MTRPRGLTATALFAALYDAVWYARFHWSGNNTIAPIVVSTLGLALAYFLLWQYWLGANWARILAILSSIVAIQDVLPWNEPNVMPKPMLGIHALFGAFLIWWLNTKRVRTFFRPNREPSSAPTTSS